MHYPLMDIQADFEINRPIRYQITAKRNYLHRRTDDNDRRTDALMHNYTVIIRKSDTQQKTYTKIMHCYQKFYIIVSIRNFTVA